MHACIRAWAHGRSPGSGVIITHQAAGMMVACTMGCMPAEAAPLLRQAHAVLPADDPSRAEAGFYMDLSALTMVGDVQVRWGGGRGGRGGRGAGMEEEEEERGPSLRSWGGGSNALPGRDGVHLLLVSCEGPLRHAC